MFRIMFQRWVNGQWTVMASEYPTRNAAEDQVEKYRQLFDYEYIVLPADEVVLPVPVEV